MINQIMYDYIKTLNQEEFIAQIKNKTFSKNLLTQEIKLKLVKV